MDSLVNIFYQLKELLIICMVGGTVFFVFFSHIAGNITWKSRSLRLLGIFMGLSVKDMLWMSAGAVRILFIICVCVFTQRLSLAHTALYVALFLIMTFTFFGLPRVLVDLINTAAIYASLMALGILIGYFRDVNNEPMILVIYILLSIFTVLYAVYFYLRGISDMVTGKLQSEIVGAR
jgi:hypothetical protein